MKNKITGFFKQLFAKVQINFFSSSSNIFERTLFNILTATLFISIFLTMGFTRVYPLNVILKWSLLITNLFIIVYILVFSKIKIERYTIIIIVSFIWFAFVSLINGTLIENQSFLLNILNMIPLYLLISSSVSARKTTFVGIISGLVIYTLSFVVYYSRDLLALDLSVRLGSFFGNQNDVAFTLVMASLLFLYYIFKKKYAFIPLFLLSLVSLLSTGSRAGLLVAIVVSFALFVFIFYKKNEKLVIGGVIVLVTIAVVVFSLPTMKPLTDRIVDMIKTLFLGEGAGVDADNSILSRIDVLINAIQLFLYSPLFGSAFSTLSFSYKSVVAHNAYAELLMRQGIISFLLFLLLFIHPLIKMIKGNRKDMVMYGFVIIGAIAFLLTLSGLYFKEQYIFLALTVATFDDKIFTEISPRQEILLFLIRKKSIVLSQNRPSTNISSYVANSKKRLVIIDKSLEEDYEKICDELVKQRFIIYNTNPDGTGLLIENDINTPNSAPFTDETLLEIYKILKSPANKMVIFSDKANFKHKFLSINFYEKLFLEKKETKAQAENNNLITGVIADEFKKTVTIKESEKRTKKVDFNKMGAILFPVIFNALSMVSLTFSLTNEAIWQKIIFSLFTAVYITITIYINYKESKLVNDFKTKLVSFLMVFLGSIVLIILISLFKVIKLNWIVFLVLFITLLINGFIYFFLGDIVTKIKKRKTIASKENNNNY